MAQGRSREGWGPERRRTRDAQVQSRRSERLLLLPAALLGALAGGGQVQCRALVQQRRHQGAGGHSASREGAAGGEATTSGAAYQLLGTQM